MADVVFTMDAEEAKAVRAFMKVVDAQKKSETGFKRQAKSSKKSTDQMVGDLKRFALGMMAFSKIAQAIKAVYQAAREEIRKTAELARTTQAQFIDLQFLGENWKDRGFRAKTMAAAAKAGIMPGGFAVGKYTFESMTSGLDPALREPLLERAIQHKRTTSLDLATISTIYGKAAALAPGREGEAPAAFALRIQNAIMKTLEEASAGPQQFASQYPRALAAGKVGGLSLAQTGGLFATLTEISGSTERAAGAMDIMMREIMTPGEKIRGGGAAGPFGGGGGSRLGRIWKEAGITDEDIGTVRLRKLAPLYGAGKMTDEDVKKLFGAEALPVAREILSNPAQLEKYTARIGAAAASGTSLVQTKREQVTQTDEIYRLTQTMAELESEIAGYQAQRADALRMEMGSMEIQRDYAQYRLAGASPFKTQVLEKTERAGYWLSMMLGMDMENARVPDSTRARAFDVLGMFKDATKNLERATANISASPAGRNAGVLE